MILTKTKKDINAVTGFVRKVGNGAHVMAPKEWIGLEVVIRPLVKVQEEEFNKEIEGLRIGAGKGKGKK
jgi:putative transposon-encoded protein